MPQFSLPSWLNRDYDPAAKFLSAYQVGASIGQAKSQLAESQRKTDMDYALNQQQLQLNYNKSAQENAIDAAYKKGMLSLENAKLSEIEKKNAADAEEAAKRLMIEQQNADTAKLAAQATQDRNINEALKDSEANQIALAKLAFGRDYSLPTGSAYASLFKDIMTPDPLKEQIAGILGLNYNSSMSKMGSLLDSPTTTTNNVKVLKLTGPGVK